MARLDAAGAVSKARVSLQQTAVRKRLCACTENRSRLKKRQQKCRLPALVEGARRRSPGGGNDGVICESFRLRSSASRSSGSADSSSVGWSPAAPNCGARNVNRRSRVSLDTAPHLGQIEHQIAKSKLTFLPVIIIIHNRAASRHHLQKSLGVDLDSWPFAASNM